MAYFVTGATGFIGRHLLERLLRRNDTVYCLVRRESETRLQEIVQRYSHLKGRVVPVLGDLLLPGLGVEPTQIADLSGKIEHFFHVAALYDLSADSESLARTNVGGTRNALELAVTLEAGCFHHVSSVAVAGHYEGTFTEAMLDQAEELRDPYASTKHDAEVLVHTEYPRPYRVYRPSVVVGHSQTGEIDKADGLYFTFRLIQRLRESVPDWLPRIGIEAGSLNVVPVDFVAQALDHIAHTKDLDGKTFHLVDPDPHKASEVMDVICRAAGAPPFSAYVEVGTLPKPLTRLIDASEQLPGVRRLSDSLLSELGIPRRILGYLGHSTEYASDETAMALVDSGIEVPPLESYAGRLWDFWELHLSSTPVRSPRLARAVEGKRVVIANATSPIEATTARRLAASGAKLILVDRAGPALEELKHRIVRAGGTAAAYALDLGSRKARSTLLTELVEAHGGADVLVCGFSQSPASSSDTVPTLTTFEGAMRVQYLSAIDLALGLLPGMRERESGQVLMLTPTSLDGLGAPAHQASAAALDAFASAEAEALSSEGVAMTSVHLPPLRVEDGQVSKGLGAITADRAAGLVCEALIQRPRRTRTWLGAAAEVTRAAAPRAFEATASLMARWPPTFAWRGRDAESPGPEAGVD